MGAGDELKGTLEPLPYQSGRRPVSRNDGGNEDPCIYYDTVQLLGSGGMQLLVCQAGCFVLRKVRPRPNLLEETKAEVRT